MHSYLIIDHLCVCGKAREKTRGGGGGGGTDDSVSLTTQHTGLAVNRPHVGRERTTLDSFGHLTLSGGSDRTVWGCGLAAASRSHSRPLISDRTGKRARRLRLRLRRLGPTRGRLGLGAGLGADRRAVWTKRARWALLSAGWPRGLPGRQGAVLPCGGKSEPDLRGCRCHARSGA
jgi:hypothetical protein